MAASGGFRRPNDHHEVTEAIRERLSGGAVQEMHKCIDLLADLCLHGVPEGRYAPQGDGETLPMNVLSALDGRKLTAEFIGTFALIFIGAGSMILGGSTVAVALAHGLALALLLSALGHVSGGFFNPALTLGLWVTRRLDTVETVTYIAVQLLGAVAAALALAMLFPDSLREVNGLGTPVLSDVTTFIQGVGLEGILAAFLMLAVLGTVIDRRGPRLGGFGIGLVLTMDILAGGKLTGAAMNPARAFGPALVDRTWDDQLVYWIGPIIGAVLAALVYHYVFMDREQRVEVQA